jgi:hypothetical protein
MPRRKPDPKERPSKKGSSRLHSPGSPKRSAGVEPAPPKTTPPPESRTDRDRGIGELGTEELDPSKPLNEPIKRPLAGQPEKSQTPNAQADDT